MPRDSGTPPRLASSSPMTPATGETARRGAKRPAAESSAEVEPVHPTHERFLNRETSWLAFNRRVLEEAQGRHNPLLERLNFLAISSNNLDEFFMKRIGGLQRQLAAGVTQLSVDGMTPWEQLTMLRREVLGMLQEQSELFEKELRPEMKKAGLLIGNIGALNSSQLAWLEDHFEKNILPILTPLGVGPGQPFPFISNLSLSLAVLVHSPGEENHRFARVKIPVNRPRFVQIPDELIFIPIEEIIAHFVDRLFIGMEILETEPFRVTRNADLERNEEEAEDLLEVIEEELRNRRFAPIVRLETTDTISQELLDWLIEELELRRDLDVYHTDTLVGMADLSQLASVDMPKYQFKPHSPVTHPSLRVLEGEEDKLDIFGILRREDILVHHPFQSFATSVLGMLKTAAADPQVVAIKQTLYRTAKNSPIVAALLEAVERGKEVNVQVEIKARFDEARNIEWVRKLEKAGAHVTYGFIGLKTHSKTMLIVRDEPDGIRRYAHIGTGNYHTGTARLYTDMGLLTCDPDICQDVADLFNYLTGHSRFENYRKLLVAPVNMRDRFLEMIQREIDKHSEDQPGHIFAKMNQLEDPDIIEALYKASQAGVKVDLIVRGFCCARPGVPGLSENIRVMSIVGRFLEHSRIYRFENGGEPEYYIGSADWMSRNLDWRVEAIVPIEHPKLQREIDHVLKTCWRDHCQAWDLLPSGDYHRRRPRRGKGCQTLFMERYGKQRR